MQQGIHFASAGRDDPGALLAKSAPQRRAGLLRPTSAALFSQN
jgi:hypothetical protein